jgi:predicted permease
MDKSTIITQVTTLFLMMAVGFAARKVKILNADSIQGLTRLLLNIAAPSVALAAFRFTFSEQRLAEAGVVFIFAVITHLFAILLGKLLFFRMPDATGKVLRFTTIFSNCGYMGYPVIGSFFGQRGIFLTSIYIAVFNIFVWTYGVFIFTAKADRDSLKQALLNPGVIAVFLGMLLFLFSVKLPSPITQTLEMVGGMTTPLAMIIVGSMLADLKFVDLFFGWSIYYGSVIRLVVMPLLAWGCLRILGVKGVVLGVCVLAVAMPAAAITVPLAAQNGGDALVASRLVFISTMLAMLVLPLLTLLF